MNFESYFKLDINICMLHYDYDLADFGIASGVNKDFLHPGSSAIAQSRKLIAIVIFWNLVCWKVCILQFGFV